MPSVSFIVPVYNVEQYLKRCLDSILAQSICDYEIVCVNDCSPDGSLGILREYEALHPDVITVVNNATNLGLGKSRERGVAAARGDYILFLDSDDYIASDYVENYMRGLTLHPDADIVIGGYIRDVNGKYYVHKAKKSIWSTITYTIACAKLFKRSFIESNNLRFPDIRVGEDIFFSLSVFSCKPKYYVLDYAGYYYYYNESSITGSLNPDSNHEKYVSDIFRLFLASYDVSGMLPEDRWIIEYTFVAHMVNALVTYGKGCGKKRMLEKLNFVNHELEFMFPDYSSNPLFRFPGPKGQTMKIKTGVYATMLAKRLGLEKALYVMISRIR